MVDLAGQSPTAMPSNPYPSGDPSSASDSVDWTRISAPTPAASSQQQPSSTLPIPPSYTNGPQAQGGGNRGSAAFLARGSTRVEPDFRSGAYSTPFHPSSARWPSTYLPTQQGYGYGYDMGFYGLQNRGGYQYPTDSLAHQYPSQPSQMPGDGIANRNEYDGRRDTMPELRQHSYRPPLPDLGLNQQYPVHSNINYSYDHRTDHEVPRQYESNIPSSTQ